MKKCILVIGGYGNFGGFIARRLSQERNVTLVIAGRSAEKAKTLADTLKAEWTVLDIHDNLDVHLHNIRPDIVIHTSGPFQGQRYGVAEACIRYKCHYIDLADGREFVSNIVKLDKAAKEENVLVMSGASSVPCLTSAIIDKYKDEFKMLESVDYGIAAAQKTSRGLATTASVLSYAGKAFKTKIVGQMKDIHGWHSLHVRKFKYLGWRLLGNCDVPDLTLFPQRYPEIKTVRFYAGMELPVFHLGLWMMAWLVRFGLIKSLEKFAPFFLKIASLFDRFGSDTSGFYMRLIGKNTKNELKQINFDLIARSGDGPYIPCMPAIIMAIKIANDDIPARGAFPCMGFIDLDILLEELEKLDIDWYVSSG